MNNKTLLKTQEPLYRQIGDIIKTRIVQGIFKPGAPIPSLNEISQDFGVSMITARQAVGRLLDEGLLYVVSGKGTFVAERPLKKTTISVAMDIDTAPPFLEDTPLNHTQLIHLKEWMDFISFESFSNNCLAINIPTSLDDRGLTKFTEDNGVAGIIILGAQRSEKILELAVRKKIPCVVLGELMKEEKKGNFVVYSNYKGAAIAARYIVEKKHKRIGILIGKLSYHGYRERLQGYRNALLQNKIAPEDILEVPCRSGIEGGYAAAKELLAAGNIPSALLCSSDFKAMGAIKAIQEKGLRIPEDIAVLGYDGLSLPAEGNLSLTTVRIPKKEMVQVGLDFLLKSVISGSGTTIQMEIEPELMHGKTA
jgi:DNA-binding LacI/PurR family transcriptional regulator/DNA-binding transcriptional regulator YhcF (GntR family)